MGVRFIAAGATDVGRQRTANEDHYRLVPEDRLWIVADGMGGHAAGQVASQMAVAAVADFISRWAKESDFVWPFEIMESRSFEENALVNAVRVANVRLYNRSEVDAECGGMGTTLVVMAQSASCGLVIAHVGDSRCYRLRGQAFTQLTQDHSLVNHLMRFFHLTREQAMARAGSNVIVRAVGLEDDVDVDLTTDQPRPGDIYLSCSDGLTDMVEDWIIQQILMGNDSLQDAADALIRAANSAGGNDNITVVLLQAIFDGQN